MQRRAVLSVAVLVAVAGVSGLAGATARAVPQRVPATRDEALSIIRQITGTIEGSSRDNLSLLGDRKVLLDASATVERLLTEFDDASSRAAAGLAAIEPELTLPIVPAENACELMASSADKAARRHDDVANSRRAISDLTFNTTVPMSRCGAGDAARLKSTTADLLKEKTALLSSVADWAAATRTAAEARRAVMSYRNSLAALAAMDDIGDRLTEVVTRAVRGYTEYEQWTSTSAPRIAALRKAASALGIEREVGELETKALAGSAEFAGLPLVFKKAGFAERLARVAKARTDGAAMRTSLQRVAPRFECPASFAGGVDTATFASELAGAIYRMDDTGRSWLATADRCEKKKAYIQHVALEATFARVRVGDTVPRPQFLQASSNVLSDPTDVGARAEWSGMPTPFTPTTAQSNMIFFVTATIEGRASTMTIFVEPARSARR